MSVWSADQRDGEEQLVIVECKHWAEEVGKEALDKLVGVGTQLEADSALIVTTVTRFRDPEDWEGMAKKLHMRGMIGYSVVDNLVLRAADPDELKDLSEQRRVSLLRESDRRSTITSRVRQQRPTRPGRCCRAGGARGRHKPHAR